MGDTFLFSATFLFSVPAMACEPPGEECIICEGVNENSPLLSARACELLRT